MERRGYIESDDLRRAMRDIRALAEFAYASGYHEFGYDPVKDVEAGIIDLERQLDTARGLIGQSV